MSLRGKLTLFSKEHRLLIMIVLNRFRIQRVLKLFLEEHRLLLVIALNHFRCSLLHSLDAQRMILGILKLF